ncbi:uncharacterized protein MEPE_06037 [Melanopsichium pennsylvanicum]|uniref:Arrestin C-terminal-like domain-containing protein n=2 Tax=Melanopsichium pennsylvanicum TaxID=63383 RepID=A0AAJ4XSZ8_9BASI|nr:putative protein [Melanopsichium pennsylvanicum 4]SNX87327.1 uncharacterized protein MEPE_06037 [Melanopsichium pennsylvanicum]
MFAPPSPIPGSRPTSAAAYHNFPQQQPYDLPRSPLPQEQRLHQSNSFSWNPELGLPPPPSQIDALGDSLHYALSPTLRPASRNRSVSPEVHSLSRYDPEFDDLQDPTDQRDRTQDHVNMVTKHPKVKVDVILSSNIFEAGGTISGKVELTCTTSQRLRLGQIAVELEAVEQLTSRDHAATQLFLYNRTMFQGDNLPPSNAVLPAAPVNNYWAARKGRTTFPFSFHLPSSAPSCVTFAGNASLRYGLKAIVQTWYNEEKLTVTARREAFVLEKWTDQMHPRFSEPVEAIGDTRLFMGGSGAVWLEAGVTEQLFWNGAQMLVRCGVKNNTKRHLSGIKVALARRLIFPVGSAEGLHDTKDKISLEPRITEIVHNQIFKGHEYEFGPNAESVCTVAVDIPRDLRTIRKTRLFEVRTFALVSLPLGSFAKDLTVEIPIYVAHTASGQQPPQHNLDHLHAGPPLQNLPQRPYSSIAAPQRPHSSMGHSHVSPPHHVYHGHHGHHAHGHLPHMDPGMLQVERLAAERGWSPAPMFDAGQRAGPARPASTAPGMVQLPLQAQPFALGPDGNLEWNPAAISWNASRLVTPSAAAGHAIQRSASAAPDMFPNVAPPQSPAPLVDPVAAWTATQPSMSASPGLAMIAQHSNFAPPQPQNMSSLQLASAPRTADRRMSLPVQGPHGGGLPEQIAYQNVPRDSLPPKPELQAITKAPMEQQQQSAPPQRPPANAFAAPPIAGLATIEEDSESQAGTINTLKKLPTIGKNGTKGAAGNSVSRNDIEQFEAMAEAEEDEEEIKRQMIAMGMKPDEDAFSSREARSQNVTVVKAAVEEATPAASTTCHTEASQASSTGAHRPRASDIFQIDSHAEKPQNPRAEPVQTTVANVSRSQDLASNSELGQPGDSHSAAPRRSSVVSLRRSSASHGLGLEALETNLTRSTTPKINSSSRAVVTMANVSRAETSSSPLASPSVDQDASTRSRKNSALRAAANARDEAERKAAEGQARTTEERQHQLREEQARQAAAAEMRAAQSEAARVREAEQQRLEKERIAGHALRQRELREQQEEQRLKVEAEKVAREQERKRLEREEEERRSRQATELRSRQAAEAVQARAAEEARESRRLADAALLKAKISSERLNRINAAIGNAPSSIAPSVPSKTTAPIFPAPGRMSDRDRVTLKQQAVNRIGGWLSNAASPNSLYMETPDTPGASVLSVMRKESEPSEVLKDDVRSSFAYRSPSQVINPLWEGKSTRSQGVEGSMPKSRTVADLTSSNMSVAKVQACATREEAVPQLSAELRALVDSSDMRPARKIGTAVKEHPISRRLSGLGSTNTAGSVPVAAVCALSASSEVKRERHTSMPSWPRPAVAAHVSTDALPAASLAVSNARPNSQSSARFARNAEAREVGIPCRVEKTLMATGSQDTRRGKDEPSYDARSARGGRGGRVASVAQLWSKIAGDDEVEASGATLAAPQVNSEPRSASPSSASTVKPKARRSSNADAAAAAGGGDGGAAPALDFSKKAILSSSASSGVTAIAATFGDGGGSTKPELMKSFAAPQFVNTSVSEPVFAKVGNATATAPSPAATKVEKRPLPKPVLQPGAVAAPTLVRPTAMRPSPTSDRRSRKISTQVLSTFEKDKKGSKSTEENVQTVRGMMCKVAVDSTILDALQEQQGRDLVNLESNDMSTSVRWVDGTEIKMSGRGTTKAIGENKLKSLRAVWGS